MAVFCCSMANAQSYSNSLTGATLIYSNAFDGDGTVSITNTLADYEAGVLGGKSDTNWVDALGGNDTNALYANGAMGTAQGDAWLLPFAAQPGYVYTLNATVDFNGNPGTWVAAGFCDYIGSIGGSNDRFNTGGVDFGILNESSRNVQAFGGPGATFNYATVNGIWPLPATGDHTLTQILDTTGAKWVAATFVDGVQAGTNYTYPTSNPTVLGVGLSQNGGNYGLSADTFSWAGFALSAAPEVITKQPVSATVAAGVVFTNTVTVAATAPFYQWFDDGVAVAGATNASLVLNPVTASDASTNYYVVITNSLGGSVTSAPFSLVVYSAPTISAAYPVTYTNVTTLYGGTNSNGTNYPGSSPTFSLSVIGQHPLYYQWLTNGAAVAGATNASLTLTNCQLNGPTNISCVITNVGGSASNTWLASYLPTPPAPFVDTVLSFTPAGFWRLNEGPDDGYGDDGAIAFDYASANNGLYTNAVLGYPGFTNTDPTDASALFDYAGSDSGVFGIQGIDFSNTPSATFSVQAWVNGPSFQPSGACLIAKGYNGGEEFALDISGNDYRFLVRNAAGAASSVTAPTGPDNNWHFIVGVCDEVNGLLTLYVDGLTVGSATIASGGGIFPSPMPISIGARGAAPGDYDSLQFNGYLSDLAVYKSALTSGQVATLYTSGGFSLGFTFVLPLPPTNAVFLANTTLTIPAQVFAQPPIGYYWSNLTTGVIMGSGETNALGNLNATLTIPNAPASLSGDELELVVTNATFSTNWFTTLFSPPPPVTLDYSSDILYSNDFDGGAWSIAGMPLTAANSLVGGTNTTWTDALGVNDTGSMMASGVDAATLGDSWVLPFTPHSGYVYTVSASLTFSGNPGSWVGLGFAQRVPTNAAVGYGRFSDGGTVPPDEGPNGYDWIILTEGSGNVQYFVGPGGSTQVTSMNGFFTAGVGTHTVQVVLDTTAAQWVMYAYVDDVSAGTNTYTSNPPIGAVGITQTTQTTPGDVQWNYFSLSQVAPNGVPPYLLSASPPTNVTLQPDASLSIPVTAFGSAPIGYYWSNTNTGDILGSGTTNSLEPLNANLSVSDVPGSWNGDTLSLVVTNAYGTNISLVTLNVTSSINTTPTNIIVTITNNNLYLSWPVDQTGFTLQAQTNPVTVGLTTNWVDVPGSTLTNQVEFPINPTNGTVFYRLLYQP